MSASSEEPLTPERADRAYRLLRLCLIASAAWFLAIAAVVTALGVSGAVIYLAIVLVIEGLLLPIVLRLIRRDLDKRVRESAESL